MKNRKVLFGYKIDNGEIVTDLYEGQAVKRIFSEYISGMSLQDIAGIMVESGIPYIDSNPIWNKNQIRRILGNKKYIGERNYPVLVSKEDYNTVLNLISERRTQRPFEERTEGHFLKSKVRCGSCGSQMQRFYDSRRKKPQRWVCVNKSCGMIVKVTDSVLSAETEKILRRLMYNPELIKPEAASDDSLSLEVRRLTNEINRQLERRDFDKNTLIALILQCAAEKYSECEKSTRHITDMLKNEFASQTRSSIFNTELFERTVSKVHIHQAGEVSLELKNGKIIRKE